MINNKLPFSKYSFGVILLPNSSTNFNEKSLKIHKNEGKVSKISFWAESLAFDNNFVKFTYIFLYLYIYIYILIMTNIIQNK